jgi:hypothetical protein
VTECDKCSAQTHQTKKKNSYQLPSPVMYMPYDVAFDFQCLVPSLQSTEVWHFVRNNYTRHAIPATCLRLGTATSTTCYFMFVVIPSILPSNIQILTQTHTIATSVHCNKYNIFIFFRENKGIQGEDSQLNGRVLQTLSG